MRYYLRNGDLSMKERRDWHQYKIDEYKKYDRPLQEKLAARIEKIRDDAAMEIETIVKIGIINRFRLRKPGIENYFLMVDLSVADADEDNPYTFTASLGISDNRGSVWGRTFNDIFCDFVRRIGDYHISVDYDSNRDGSVMFVVDAESLAGFNKDMNEMLDEWDRIVSRVSKGLLHRLDLEGFDYESR